MTDPIPQNPVPPQDTPTPSPGSVPAPDLKPAASSPPPPSFSPPPAAPPPVREPQPVGDGPVKIAANRPEVDVSPPGAVPFNTRFMGGLIDLLLGFGVSFLLAMILPDLLSFVGTLVFVGYMLTRDALPFLNGQSVGKRAMKIRAVDLAGNPLTGRWEPSIIRNVSIVIPFFVLVEIYFLMTREGKADAGKRLGDEWGKTKVIFEPVAGEIDAGPVG